MRKILSMMISICAANALFASSLYTIRDGKLFEVERTYSGTYRTKIGYNPVNESEILVLSNFNDISIAFGDGAYADDTKPGGGGIAIGVRARAKRDPSVSGPGEGNIAIGNDARATGHMAIALGSNSKAEQQHSIAIGFGADSSEKDHSVAVGQNSKAIGLESSAFGSFAKALGEHSVGIGYGATAEGRVSIALGQGAKVTGSEQGSTAIGWEAIASGEFANAIGKKANASTHSNAIGFGAQSLNQSSAIGEAAYSKGRYSSAIGHQARSYANNSVAIGSNAVTYGRDKNTYTSAYSSISIGEFARAGLSEKLTQSEYDELDGRLQKNYYVEDGNGYKLKPFDIESDRGNIAIGTYSLATSIRSVAIGIGAESMSSNAVSLGYGSKALWNDSTALGSKAKAMANYSTAVGYGALARSERSVSVGYEAKARSEKSVSVGYEAKAGLEEELDESRYNSLADTYKQYYKKDNGKYKLKNSNQNNIAIGYNSESLGASSLALGYGSVAAKDHAISLGTKSNTQGSYSISVGHEAKASNDNSIALGYQANAQKDNSVALGGKSVASIGSGVIGLDFATNNPSKETNSAWRSTAGAVSVGDETKKITRQITNVAAGTQDTDAVNVAQLKSLKDYSDKTFASKTELNNITNNLNSKVSDVTGKNNIKVESDPNDTTKKIVSLEKDIDLTDGGSIKFGSGKTDITKDKITSKDLVATNGTNKVTISGDDGTITGLTNTTWDKNNIVENRAATEGQLQSLQNNLENNLNNTIGTTLGSYKIKGDDGVHNIYDNKTLTIKGDTNIKTKATEDGNLDIKLSKNLDLKDGSITLNNAKLDENGLTVGDNVKITKDTIQNGDVELTKDGLDNGDKKIVNVAPGTEDNDAATVGQLKNIAVGASGVKESDKKDKWAEKRPEAKGKNSVSIAGGSTDGGRNNTVSVGSKGNQRTISNVAPGVLNSDAATVGQLKAGLNNVHGKLDEYKKDSRAGTASAMAIGNLPQSTIPGKGMVSLGGGFYDGESAMAIGLSKMSDDGKWVVKGSASYDSQENAGAAVSVGFHF